MLFITSDGFYSQNIIDNFEKLLPENRENMKVAIVSITSRKKEAKKFEEIETIFTNLGLNFEFININSYNVKNLLNFDILFLNGGNPYQLLAVYKQKGLDKILEKAHEQNKIIVGVSGSSIILAPNVELMNDFIPQFNKNFVTDFTGFNLIDFHVFPHYGRSDELFGTADEIEKKITDFEKNNDTTVARLSDEEIIRVA